MAKLTHVVVVRASDVEIHHEGVTLAGDKLGGKALDKHHGATIQAFAKAKDVEALTAFWKQSLQNGAIPGTYRALMAHRHVTPNCGNVRLAKSTCSGI